MLAVQCNRARSSPDSSRGRGCKMAACRRALAFIERSIKSQDVVVFSKTTCPFSILAKKVLRDVGVRDMKVFELEQRDDEQHLQGALHELTGRATVPNVFIRGQSIGGGTEVAELYQSGRLKSMLQEHGILKE